MLNEYVLAAACDLLGPDDWTDNPEYTRAIIELTRNLTGIGPQGHEDDSVIEQAIRRAGRRA